jgi:hypothetical protein
MRSLLATSIVALLVLLGHAVADDAPKAGSAGKFVHPGIYHNFADLAFMRKKIEAKAEPWWEAWNKLTSEARLTWKPHPVEEWNANKNAYMQGDAVAAYAHALRWSLSGEPAHADKAIEILNAWSSTLKTITGTTSQEMVVCGWNGCHLANAAELLVHGAPPGGKPSGWAPADVTRSKKMLGMMYDVIKDFKPRFNGNWDAAMMNTMLCIAVFSDDRAMFDRAIDHFHGKYAGDAPQRPRNGHLTGYILPTGQCQESGRDQGHTQMGLGNYVAICEVARRQGVDLYGAENNRLLLGLEYTVKYNLGQDVLFEVVPGTNWTKISETDRGRFLPILEAAYQHYVYRKGLQMPFAKQVIFGDSASLSSRRAPGPYRPEPSTPNAGICVGTLTTHKEAEGPHAAKY